ncbi:hypothetical protein HHI36_008622 [Cryptolaemus montrouzieri]|uniref:Uncharacterized protein n=1 Tax=Cryptolaemus montrouzieri TaxID=559131 RepID=A0ABD2MTJ0_9CUCU
MKRLKGEEYIGTRKIEEEKIGFNIKRRLKDIVLIMTKKWKKVKLKRQQLKTVTVKCSPERREKKNTKGISLKVLSIPCQNLNPIIVERTSLLHLEPRWQTKPESFKLYESFCENQNKGALKASICTFYGLFDGSNLSLFQP